MRDIIYYGINLCIPALVVAASCIHEYYFSKKVLKENPNCSYDEIVKYHSPIAKLLAPFGIAGHEIARNRFSHHIANNSELSDYLFL